MIRAVSTRWTSSRIVLHKDYERWSEELDMDECEGETLTELLAAWREAHPEWRRVAPGSLPAPWVNRYGWRVLAGEIYEREPGSFLFLTTGGGLYTENHICEICNRRPPTKFVELPEGSCPGGEIRERVVETVIGEHAWFTCEPCMAAVRMMFKELAALPAEGKDER